MPSTTPKEVKNLDHTTISDIDLADNMMLSICEAQVICDFLAIPTNPAVIGGNAPGCDSRIEVETACNAVGLEEINWQKVEVYPNPTEGKIYLNGVDKLSEKKYLLMDDLGQKLGSGEFKKEALDLEGFPDGLYFLQIGSKNNWIIKKVVKL